MIFSLNEKNSANYEILKSTHIEEHNLDVVEIRHKVTKALIILMITDDKNRVFNIAFKTPVTNGKGTPHILEHSVLCGSRKYNVKDPFIELAKSSMNTFLNAMTFPDKTCYPVASANLKDFHNLMDVYLDAVFYPNAVKHAKIFRQEGWHYEIEDASDDLKVNGVVLNEMRGVYSNPDDILESCILHNLYNGTNYQYEYGGNPDEIINLSFDEFKDFHRKYYSPSNAIIYLYGELDYNYELEKLQSDYLKDFSYIDVDASFKKVSNYKKDNIMTSYYNVDTNDLKDKAYFAYSFSFGEAKSSLDKIVLIILDYILFLSESAILRNKFLEMGLGESVYTVSEFGIKEAFYSVISQNIDESKKDEFINTLFTSINELIDKGIDKEKLKAAINIIHFNYAEGEFGRMPKGLVLSITSLDTVLYGEDPEIMLTYKDEFNYLSSIDLDDKNNIFYKMLKKVFIDNEHRVFNMLLPKKGYSKEKEIELKGILEKRKSEMTDQELLLCIDSCKELKLYQSEKDSAEDLSCIPTLKISDLEKTGTYIHYIERDETFKTIVTYDNDREIVYTDVRFDITDFTKEEIYLFSVISMILSKVDLRDMSYIELDNYIASSSGGLDIKFDVYEKKINFTISVKTFVNKCKDGYDIIYKLLHDAIFVDTNRIEMLLGEVKANDTVNILSSGHMAAITRAESNLTFSSNILDKIASTGIAKHLFLDSFLHVYSNNSETINNALTLLYKKLLSKSIYISMSLNEKYKEKVDIAYDEFSKKLSKYREESQYSSEDERNLKGYIDDIRGLISFDSFEKKDKKEAIVVPSNVNFVAVANSFDRNEFSGRLDLIKTIFNYEYLWTNIRVLGGAYGCMSFFKRSGNYLFTSYRDPNLSKTNETFYGIYDYLKNINITNDTLEKYIIGSVGAYDNPQSVIDRYKKNISAYFNEVMDDTIRKEREELINMKVDDIKKIAEIFSDIRNSDACAIISEKAENDAKKDYDKVWKLMV